MDDIVGTAFYVRIRTAGTMYQIAAFAVDDSQEEARTAWTTLADGPHAIELAWVAASAPSTEDGSLTVWIDGEEAGQVTGIDNDTLRIDEARLGALSPSSAAISGSVFLDDYISTRNGPIGLDPNVTLPPSYEILTDGFESGDFSAWSSAETDGGNLSVASAAAIEGSYGLQAVVDEQAELYVRDERPVEVDLYQARFYFDPNSVVIPAGATLEIFRGLNSDSDTIFSLQLGMVNNDYAIRAVMVDDEQQIAPSDWTLVTNGPHCLELEWWQAWSEEVSDGRMLLWIDESGDMVLQDVDNDTQSVEAVELGTMAASSASTEGTLFFDDFSSNRGGNHIGFDPNVTLPSPDAIFADGFEGGDLSAWSSAETGGDDLSVESAAAMEGSYGLQALVDDQAELYVHDGQPLEAGLYQARFYFDPNSVKIPAEATLDIFRGLTSDTNTAFTLQLGMLGDDYAIRAVMLDDEQQSAASDWIPITNSPHCLELQWWRAESAEVSDGRMQLWIDENGGMVLQDVDNDSLSIDAVDLGVLSPSTTTISGTVYFDDFSSNGSGSYIGLNENITLLSADEIFLDGFESADLSAWNSAETDSGDLSVTTSAVLYGSYGLSALVDDATPLFVQDNSPIHELHYRARFYFDPNSIAIPAGYSLRLFEGRDLTAGTVLRIDLRYSDDEYQVEATILDDSQTSTDTGWTAVTDAPHALEVEWLAAWDSENADGGLIFWVDGEESGYIPWIDNDTHRVDTVRLGAPAVGSASTSGTLYLDDFVSHKSEYIGLNEQQRSSMQETGVRTLPASPARSQALRLSSTPTSAPVIQSLQATSGEVSRTIDYTYDGLHRLTEADYDNGDYYAYSYDAVGNRLVLDSDANGNSVYLEYTYDNANRLATVGEVTYTWDPNGNLLEDGVNTYTYDSANRLVTVSGDSLAESFGYNGLNERLEQTVNSQATEFVMDLNGGLSQVLDDGTNTYTYGLGRLSQINGSGAEYFLEDALGSVRQLADATGAITLAKSYDPYGNVIGSEGEAESIYGYDGEQTDSYIKLINLRSRLYDPASGRFTTRDSWQGDYNRPLSLNKWNFVEGNPVNREDPSGQYGIGHFIATHQASLESPAYPVLKALISPFGAEFFITQIATNDSMTDFDGRYKGSNGPLYHFSQMSTAQRYIADAIAQSDPDKFGHALHMMQDTFSHVGEGISPIIADHTKYTVPSLQRTAAVTDDFLQGWHMTCVRGVCVKQNSPMKYFHPDARNELQRRNPNLNVSNLSIGTVIDIYMRGDAYNPDLEAERLYFGFDTDLYMRGTARDDMMYQETKNAVTNFLQAYILHSCREEP